MFIRNQAGRKEHIFLFSGRRAVIGRIAIASSHITGTAAGDAALVTVKGVAKDDDFTETDRVLLDEVYLNVGNPATDAVLSVFELEMTSDQFVGVTIEIDTSSDTLKEIHSCHVTWTSSPILETGTNVA